MCTVSALWSNPVLPSAPSGWSACTRWALVQAYADSVLPYPSSTALCCDSRGRQATPLSCREAPRDQGIQPQTAAGRMHRPVDTAHCSHSSKLKTCLPPKNTRRSFHKLRRSRFPLAANADFATPAVLQNSVCFKRCHHIQHHSVDRTLRV